MPSDVPSVTDTVKVAVVAVTAGVPLKIPVDDMARPVGGDPAVTDHVWGVLERPPTDASVWE